MQNDNTKIYKKIGTMQHIVLKILMEGVKCLKISDKNLQFDLRLLYYLDTFLGIYIISRL